MGEGVGESAGAAGDVEGAGESGEGGCYEGREVATAVALLSSAD